ncbi:putative short-chain dehydrogenase [Hyaloscypha hepaticicola]|uniref:Putative short-chain dehydrogenase n=1 Tax=Hyaloscypha hepaticicola TaxID=2082293 RepID=A0A2J6QC54_9HELO|nr:putative short-chain dehydrogenase [Hyaloscypha hepaticicola]
MSSTSPVLLILGSGPRIGSHVARAFAAKGYKVALASRKVKEADNTADQINIPSDLSDPNSVVNAFSKVKELIGTPSVVVYNAGAVTSNDAKDPLSLPVADFTRDFTINTTSAFVAAQQAVLSFKELPDSAARTFIYTGNITNEIPLAPLLDLGVGKSATAHIIQSAAAAYKDKGYKFYYGDERKADGSAAFMDIDGEAHGKLYVELAEGKEQGPWQQTFVKGVGYKQFPHA